MAGSVGGREGWREARVKGERGRRGHGGGAERTRGWAGGIEEGSEGKGEFKVPEVMVLGGGQLLQVRHFKRLGQPMLIDLRNPVTSGVCG